MITITYDKVMAALALFTAACVAAGWVIKIVRAAKKPTDDINAKLDNDNNRLKIIEEEMDYINRSITLLMRCDLAILAHLQTGNETGRMSGMEREIQDFLLDR